MVRSVYTPPMAGHQFHPGTEVRVTAGPYAGDRGRVQWTTTSHDSTVGALTTVWLYGRMRSAVINQTYLTPHTHTARRRIQGLWD